MVIDPAWKLPVKVMVPAELKILKASGGPFQPNVQGQVVTFQKIPTLEPGKTASFTIEVEALRAE